MHVCRGGYPASSELTMASLNAVPVSLKTCNLVVSYSLNGSSAVSLVNWVGKKIKGAFRYVPRRKPLIYWHGIGEERERVWNVMKVCIS